MKQLNILGFLNDSSKSGFKQFLLSLLATTISIVLTFGTSAIIERNQKEAAKKEMVMMIIYDFDKTIEQMQLADNLFQQANQAQQQIAQHPEYFDSLRFQIMAPAPVASTEYSETTEKIFSSNIETFNTLGNVNFVHEVSLFYNTRRFFQENVIELYKQDLPLVQSLDGLLKVDFPNTCFAIKRCLWNLQEIRDRCMQIMRISEKELKEFGNQRSVSEEESEEHDEARQQIFEKMLEEERVIIQAREELGLAQ